MRGSPFRVGTRPAGRGALRIAGALSVLGASLPAHAAEVHLDGRYRQSALREDFTVQQWLNGCGPTPQSGSTGGGETVEVRVEGDELAFVGGGRVYRTNQCYDPMPSLGRETHSRDANGKTWRTRCTTPPSDPRKAILNTLIVATTDSHIDIVETGRYEIVLESGSCMADVKRTRSYDLVSEKAAAPQASTSAVAPAAREAKPDPKPLACASPGDPTRLEVRPSHKLLRTGESFVFRPLVLDDKGCATRTATTWTLAPGAEGKGVSVEPNGTVKVSGDAPEGTIEVVATAAGKSTRVAVEVTSPAHYDDLLARSGLNASGETDDAASVSIGTQSIGAGEGQVEDRARARRLSFVAIIVGALLVLGILAIVVLRRSRRAAALARVVEDRHEARVRDVMDRRRLRADEHAAQQRAHEESIAAARAAAAVAASEANARAAQAAAPPKKDMVCPTCSREFESPTSFCPHDGAPLDPKEKKGTYPAPAAMARTAASPRRGKICPTCGDRFDGAAEFCGKDGTQLVLLN